MKIILFGKTGAGKSYIGDYLQSKHCFHHFDADQILTDEMKACIRLNKLMTPVMVDQFVESLKKKIAFFYHQYSTSDVVISQGLYRNKNRLDLAKQFPKLQFVWVNTDEQVCYKRVAKRTNWVTVEYAKKISHLFEEPEGFNHIELKNSESLSALDLLLKKMRRHCER